MQVLIREFNSECNKFIKEKLAEYEIFKKDKLNPDTAKEFKKKYPFVTSKYKIPLYGHLINYEEIQIKFNHKQLLDITQYLINKITGIFKHAQSEKTGFCNIKILQGINNNKFMICITKNTLESNGQWTKRLIKELKIKFPHTNPSELILVCSSKKNDLNGNATHCKNVDNVITKMLSGNFKILFVCSNNKRVEDILKILKAYENFTEEKRLLIDIQHDEAHNLEEGLPSKRDLFEHILLNVYINAYIPISASPNTIYDDTNPLWKKEHIEHNAIDYTHFSKIKSTSPDYSSLSDANTLHFEQIKQNPLYNDYNIKEFNKEYLKKVYAKSHLKDKKRIMKEGFELGLTMVAIEKEIQLCIDSEINIKSQLEFCVFMNGECELYNIALNLLDNKIKVPDDNLQLETNIFKMDQTNIHLITTPCRIIFTYSLMKYAISKDYTPILIGLYGGKINVMYKKYNGSTMEEIEQIMGDEPNCDKELNEKIDFILEDLKKINVNINVPIIIIGNYKPSGESITFVNYKYGTLRSVIILPSINQTSEKDYQNYSRLNYMDTLFKRNNSDFIHPPKWMIGYEENIKNALDYELLNDKRIDELEEKSTTISPLLIAPDIQNESHKEDNNISIPIKINIQDCDDSRIKRLFEILDKSHRSNDFEEILSILQNCKEDELILWDDTTDKFKFDTFNLISVRTYRKPSDEDIKKRQEELGDKYKPIESTYRFKKYDACFKAKTSYINEKNKMKKNTCELLVANDKYIYEKFINYKTQLWLSYKY